VNPPYSHFPDRNLPAAAGGTRCCVRQQDEPINEHEFNLLPTLAATPLCDHDHLTSVTYADGSAMTQTYDRNVNIIQRTDARNRYTSIGGVAQTYDANGNLLHDGDHHDQYDVFDRLVGSENIIWTLNLPLVVSDGSGFDSATTLNPASAPGSRPSSLTPTSAAHAYDALSRRVNKQVGDKTERYRYDGDRVIEERDDSDELIASYVGSLLMARGGVRSFYQTDAWGSTRALADDNGAVVERVDYEAFGEPIFAAKTFQVSETWKVCSYLCRGWRYAAADGLYVRGRQRYDPAHGRNFSRNQRRCDAPWASTSHLPCCATECGQSHFPGGKR